MGWPPVGFRRAEATRGLRPRCLSPTKARRRRSAAVVPAGKVRRHRPEGSGDPRWTRSSRGSRSCARRQPSAWRCPPTLRRSSPSPLFEPPLFPLWPLSPPSPPARFPPREGRRLSAARRRASSGHQRLLELTAAGRRLFAGIRPDPAQDPQDRPNLVEKSLSTARNARPGCFPRAVGGSSCFERGRLGR